MKFDTKDIAQAHKAFEYLEVLQANESIVEIKKVNPKRTLNQNNYLHLLLAAFGEHFGYTIEESKLIYKELNKGVYQYEKKGRTFTRSSAELDTAELSKTIDLFRLKSAEQGYELPLATDKEWLMQIENQIEQSKHYL